MGKTVFFTGARDGDPAATRLALARATEAELEAFEQFVLRERSTADSSQSVTDRAIVRVCDRWLEWVAEVRLFRELAKVHNNLDWLWQSGSGGKLP